jgi:predicted secreted Zn-dependent protease
MFEKATFTIEDHAEVKRIQQSKREKELASLKAEKDAYKKQHKAKKLAFAEQKKALQKKE